MRLLPGVLAAGLIAAAAWCPAAQATLVVPGDYQTENGGATDWDPPTAPAMTENPPASGVFELNLSSLSGAGAGSFFKFKILDDEGTPPANWGDPELTPVDTWFLTDAGGNASITIDRNVYSDGFEPSTNRLAVSTDATESTGFFATGNWMVAAGGSGDWINNDPMFQMSDLGGGLWGVDATIATPGSYEWKATKGDWDGQWGTNGRNTNASTWLFTTTQANQPVTFLLDLGQGAISYQTIPEPTSALLLGVAAAAMTGVARRRR